MKSVLLLPFFVLISFCASGQKIHFSDSTNQWYGFLAHENGTAWGFEPYWWRYQGDTTIAGISYHRLVTTSGFTPALAIREDSINEQIYFRFIWPGFTTDTAEHLFFDYNLKIGDTFRVCIDNSCSVYSVSAVGTVLLGGVAHRTWKMIPDSLSTHNGFMSYTFIEGLGTTAYPIMSVLSTSYDHEARLLCFHNKGNQPLMSPRIDLFDNDSSCSYWPVAVTGPAAKTSLISLSPNPATSTLTLHYSQPLPNTPITISISNTVGQLLQQTSLIPQGMKTDIPLSEGIPPGMYRISVQSKGNPPIFRGNFLKL